jgi:hypothetical protein
MMSQSPLRKSKNRKWATDLAKQANPSFQFDSKRKVWFCAGGSERVAYTYTNNGNTLTLVALTGQKILVQSYPVSN